jgi:hypothetical protein
VQIKARANSRTMSVVSHSAVTQGVENKELYVSANNETEAPGTGLKREITG